MDVDPIRSNLAITDGNPTGGGVPSASSVSALEEGEGRVRGFGIVLDFCPNGTLEERIILGGRLNESDCLRWTHQIAAALAHVHSKGVIHLAIQVKC